MPTETTRLLRRPIHHHPPRTGAYRSIPSLNPSSIAAIAPSSVRNPSSSTSQSGAGSGSGFAAGSNSSANGGGGSGGFRSGSSPSPGSVLTNLSLSTSGTTPISPPLTPSSEPGFTQDSLPSRPQSSCSNTNNQHRRPRHRDGTTRAGVGTQNANTTNVEVIIPVADDENFPSLPSEGGNPLQNV